ncbi:ImmA/IrrE family metallo-endopeptidase [Bacillus haynesii]|uniref:ImmA/IrrE family metallo-endopeptidase n=1 Tax=Bacillus haynesii TaxID=1925021 RepID=UPI0022832BBE|nr:ImmA/IrrE family metallo-endopeptidase [Bacillus haynesii]MCY8579327.1 ImmA/IrrE family metallo-endopeptidase [Bacillus haynesii]
MKTIVPHNTHLEDWIEAFYKEMKISNPHELDLLDISHRLGLKVEFLNIGSRYYDGVIILDNRISPQEQWQDFGHELCHALRHEGNQLIMSPLFAELQEMQAKIFAYKFCVPLFMLKRLNYLKTKAISEIATLFNVTNEFAHERINIGINLPLHNDT